MKIIQFFVVWAGTSGVLMAADVPWGGGRFWAILVCICAIALAHHITAIRQIGSGSSESTER